MQIFSRVPAWIAFVVLVIASLIFFDSEPRGWQRMLAYLGILISVYCLASASEIAERLRRDEAREMHELFEAWRERVDAVRERNKKAYEDAMREQH